MAQLVDYFDIRCGNRSTPDSFDEGTIVWAQRCDCNMVVGKTVFTDCAQSQKAHGFDGIATRTDTRQHRRLQSRK